MIYGSMAGMAHGFHRFKCSRSTIKRAPSLMDENEPKDGQFACSESRGAEVRASKRLDPWPACEVPVKVQSCEGPWRRAAAAGLSGLSVGARCPASSTMLLTEAP
jgi:hypothetical protein